MSSLPEIFVLTGLTASGKTEVGLVLAETLSAEIVSVDSMKIYRGLDIGTDKPSPEVRARTRHHLMDIREPWEGYNAYEFKRDAEAAAGEIDGRGKRVLFEGGTPLYLKVFLEGIFDGPPPDPALRARLEEEVRKVGSGAMHARLAGLDPEAASRIHPNDARRTVRALEVHEQTGLPISRLQVQFGSPRPGLKVRLAALFRPRSELKARIAARLEGMFERGFLDEARRLLELRRGLSPQAEGALGYRELWSHARGEIPLEEARARIERRTALLARRQLNWLRHFSGAAWFDASRGPPGEVAGRVAAFFAGRGGPDLEEAPRWGNPPKG